MALFNTAPRPPETFTREDLVEAFSAFDSDFRRQVIHKFELAIHASEPDDNTDDESATFEESMRILKAVKGCCQKAQDEFDELSHRVTPG